MTPWKITTLENGIRVISYPLPGVRSVSVGVLIGAGSRHETLAEEGCAHFLEHMLFQGTGQRSAREIAEMMEISGGGVGAFTARDYTVYHATVLDNYLPFALEILGDLLCNSTLPEESIERERAVILNEIRGSDSPLERLNDLLKSGLWSDDPLGRPVSGSEQALGHISRDSLMAFKQKHYVPANLIVVAAGSVEHELLVEHTQDAFWVMKASTYQAPQSIPRTQASRLLVQPADLGQTYFAAGWPAPGYTAAERYSWHVFSYLFGASPTSRLYQDLREDRGLVYTIDAQYQAYQGIGAFVIEGSTLPENILQVLMGSLGNLIGMTDQGPTLEEQHRAITALVSQHLVTGDTPYVQMSRLALQQHYFGQLLPTSDITAAIEAVTPADICGVANHLCDLPLPIVSLVGPVSDRMTEHVVNMLNELGGPVDVEFCTPAQTSGMVK